MTATPGPELDAMRVQLLQELAPTVTRTAFLATRDVLEQHRGVVPPAGMTLIPVLVDVAEQYEEAFATILRERADALMVSSGPLNYTHVGRIVAFASSNNLPGDLRLSRGGRRRWPHVLRDEHTWQFSPNSEAGRPDTQGSTGSRYPD